MGEGPEGVLRGDSAVALGRGARAISSPRASVGTGLARDTWSVQVHVVTHGSYCCGFPSQPFREGYLRFGGSGVRKTVIYSVAVRF